MPKFTASTILAAMLVFSLIHPLDGHAEPARSGADYAQIDVPDVQQAVSFFRNVLDCEAIDSSTTNKISALMVCDSGQVLELVRMHSGGSRADAPPLRFLVNDVANADRWLESEGARVVGKPVRATSGPDAGRTMINFTSPWGQRLQLVGSSGNTISALP